MVGIAGGIGEMIGVDEGFSDTRVLLIVGDGGMPTMGVIVGNMTLVEIASRRFANAESGNPRPSIQTVNRITRQHDSINSPMIR